MGSPPSVAAAGPCDAPANEIVAENCLPGNPASEWDVAGAGDASIQGYATDISVDQGQTIGFKIDTPSTDYRLDIYRLGYYGGLGARKVHTVQPSATLPQTQPACQEIDGTTNDNLIDCGNWGVSASWAVPTTAVSGIYIARAVREDVGGDLASHIAFIVRDDDGGSDLLFQTSDTTWQAYNGYGGYSLYANSGHAHKVSYNRPFTTRANPTEDWLFNAEFPMLRWLERNGYDVSYFTDVDADRNGAEIREHEAFLSVGHDEYWSAGQRANVEAARDAGVDLAFFSGNEIYWKTRWEPSTADGGSTDYRTLVSYKEGNAQGSEHYDCAGNFSCDPDPDTWTGLWRENQNGHDGGQPENSLSGQISWGDATTAIQVPASATGLRFWRNTGMTGATTLTAGTLGYEFDWEQPAYASSNPQGRITLSDTTAVGKNHRMSLYRAPSGALVFGAGTVQWSWGLDGTHDRGSSTEDPRMQQATVNLLSDMGAQPATLQAGLVAGGPLDATAPTASITDPADGATVPGGNLTISGTAADVGGSVAAVEVSTDGGATWARATGTTSWTYTFNASNGSVTAQARAVDDAANIGAAVSVTFTAAAQVCPCSIFTPSTTGTEQNDPSAVELGVKFRSDVAGFITGIRFYKTSGNTGTHTGRLWTTAGANLGTVAFSGESATGWQEAAFGAPIAIDANTTYVASYHTTSGNYPTGTSFATAGVDSPPLHALQEGVDGSNGVYRYGAGGVYPTSTFGSSNYLVDVTFVENTGPDTTPPTITSRAPAPNASGVAVGSSVSATFSEPMAAGSIDTSSFELRDPASALVPATVTYNAGTRTATLDPTGSLDPSTTYSATVKGGAGGVTDAADPANPLAADVTWSFTTAAPPPPPPDEGPGGPILVVSSAANPFSRYYVEILRNEGLNAFNAVDISSVNATMLADYDVVILGEVAVSAAQAAMLETWVSGGGNLIAMRPDADLAPLLGLTDAGTDLSDAYLQIDTAAGTPGAGLVGQTIQFHGTADRYALNGGAESVATLYATASTPTSAPAVTLRSFGTEGGQAAAFTYDLARSIVYTRQGNPAWAGQERDGQQPPIIRSDDMFYPDWIDFSKIQIPQADEQQRLLANLIELVNRDQMPLPRFWYFPRGEKAVVVMTGDDHASNGGTAGQFDWADSVSPAGCSVLDWECVRQTSYLYPNTPLSDAAAATYESQGFEVGVHVNTDCADWTPSTLAGFYADQLASFATNFPSVPAPSTHRTHCITWSDWATQPNVELGNGIRLDTNYYYWPAAWVQNRPGWFTGSGMPMRFADLDGSLIDVYQATTQMPDESGLTYSTHINTLLDNAIGASGYYGVVTTNMHTDSANHVGQQTVVNAALARGVPVVSARQMLTWLDGRNGSSFENLTWNAGTMTFSVSAGAGSNGLQALLPTQAASGSLQSLTRGGNPVTFATQTIKGIEYAVFDAAAGAYTAVYDIDGAAPIISSIAAVPGADGTATLTWTTDEPSTSRVDHGTAPGSLTPGAVDPALVTSHSRQLTGLAPNTTYYFQVISTDAANNTATAPASPATFTTPTAAATDTSVADFGAGTTGASTYVSDTAGGEVILAPTVGAEFSGTNLPSGWVQNPTPWDPAGTVTVSGGQMVLHARSAATTATFGPGTSVEFVATFGAQRHQHFGFINGVAFNAPWIVVSTGTAGDGVYARSDGNQAGVSLGTGLQGSPHRYRIAWTATGFDFYVDGATTPTATLPGAVGETLNVGGSDLELGTTMSIDWARVAPYASPGTFLSRIHDAGSSGADWGNLSYVATVPSGTTLGLDVRTGDTPTPDVTWTDFAAVASGGDVTSSGRYLQYRATATSSTGAITSTLESVTLPYTAASDTTAPSIVGRTPASAATDVAVDTNVTVTFDEPIDPTTVTTSSLTLRAQGASSDTPATVGVTGATATLDPTADLAADTVYTVTVAGSITDGAGNPLGASDSWSFTTAPPPDFGCPCSIWPATAVPASPAVTDNQPIEVGVKFRSDVGGWITGVRYYKGAANVGTHVGHLWTAGGTKLAEATFTAETASGWQQVDFSTPVAITAGTTYVASYHSSSGYFAIDLGYFTTTGVDSPPLHALQAGGANGPNGVYRYGVSGFPDGGSTANYWVDVAFASQIDQTAPTITARDPLSDATGVPTNANVTVTFDEPMNASTIDETSFRLRASGAGSDVPAVVTYGGTTATLDPSIDLAPFTTYDVTVAGSVTDTTGNPLGSAATWSFTTGAATQSLVDTTVADFGAGTTGTSTYVADSAGGEVTLAPTVGAEFGGTNLPSGWESAPWTGGTAAVAGGALSVDGAYARTTALFDPGHAIEFRATFGDTTFQNAGLGYDLDSVARWAVFGIGNTSGQLYARVAGTADVALGGSYLGSPHTYRIDWAADAIRFYVDGVLVRTHNAAVTGQMRPIVSDYTNGAPTLSVDWLRMTPYATSGTFTSRVLDAGTSTDWTTLGTITSIPTGTTATFETRSGGSTDTGDPSWSAWAPVSGGAVGSPNARYLQYRIDLTTTDPAITPAVERVEVSSVSTPVNQAPTAVDDTVSATEDTPLVLPASGSGSPAANDTDPDGDGLTVSAVAPGATGGTVGLAAGQITFTPDADRCGLGAGSFGYTVSDGTLTDEGVVSVDIACVNDAPVAADDAYPAVEDSPLVVAAAQGVLANDADIDGDALSAVLVDDVAHGTLSLAADGSFAYTPAAGFSGSDGFTYRAADGTATSAVATVTISVTAVDDAPVCLDGSRTTAEDTVLADAVSCTDGDTASLTYALGSDVAYGTLVLDAAGTFTYTPAADYAGADSFTFTASDGTTTSPAATISITVTPVNDAPVLTTPADQTSTEGATVSLQVTASDVDNASLTYGAAGLPAGLSISPTTGLISGTLGFDSAGSHTVTVSVTDGVIATPLEATFDWTVTNTTGPTATLTSSAPEPTNAPTIPVSVTFSEAVTGFSPDDLIVTNATVGDFSGSGTSYAFVLTPTADGAVSVAIPADAGQNGAGAGNEASEPLSRTVDRAAPTITLTSPADGSTIGDTTPTFSGIAGTATGDEATVTVRVYAGTSIGGTPLQTLTATAAAGGAYAVDATALPLGTYTARASQSDAAGNTGTSPTTTFTITDLTPPASPTDLTVTARSTGLAVNWADNTEADLAGYIVYRSASAGGPWTRLNAALLTSSAYVDGGAPTSATSYYRVVAVDGHGNESAPAATSGDRPSIAFVAASTAQNRRATSLVIPRPAGTAGGDVLVAALALAGNPSINVPSGWTLVQSHVIGSYRQVVYVRAAGTNETPTYAWSFSSSTAVAGAISAYRGVDATDPVEAAAGRPNASSSTITAPGVVTSSPDALLVGIFGIANNALIAPPTGMVEQFEVVTSGNIKVTIESADRFVHTPTDPAATDPMSALADKGAVNVGQAVALRPADAPSEPPIDTEAPSVPTDVVATAASPTRVDVTWRASSDNVGVDHYDVYRNDLTDKVGTSTRAAFADTSASPGTTYTYEVVAVDASGNASARSAASNEVTTPATPPPPPPQVTFRSATFAANKNSNTLQLGRPSGVASGDLLLASIDVRGAPTITPPSGWTLLLDDVDGTTLSKRTYWRIAGPGEPAAYVWTFSANAPASGGIIAYRDVDPTAPIAASAGQVNASSTTIGTPSVEITEDRVVLVALFGVASNVSITPPSGMTERGEAIGTGGNRVASAGADEPHDAGPSHSHPALASKAAVSIGHVVVLRPKAP